MPCSISLFTKIVSKNEFIFCLSYYFIHAPYVLVIAYPRRVFIFKYLESFSVNTMCKIALSLRIAQTNVH